MSQCLPDSSTPPIHGGDALSLQSQRLPIHLGRRRDVGTISIRDDTVPCTLVVGLCHLEREGEQDFSPEGLSHEHFIFDVCVFAFGIYMKHHGHFQIKNTSYN